MSTYLIYKERHIDIHMNVNSSAPGTSIHLLTLCMYMYLLTVPWYMGLFIVYPLVCFIHDKLS